MPPSFARQSRRVSMLALFIACAPNALRAQRISDERVRITSFRVTHEGTLMSLDSATVVMRSYRGDILRFPVENVSSAQVLRGRRIAGTGRIAKGALIGLGIGAALGLYALGNHGGGTDAAELSGIRAIASVAGSTILGTAIGGVLAFQKVDNWQPFDPRYPERISTPQ